MNYGYLERCPQRKWIQVFGDILSIMKFKLCSLSTKLFELRVYRYSSYHANIDK